MLDVGQFGQQGFGGLLRALPVAVRVGGGIGLRLFGQLPRAAPDVARGLLADAPLHRQRIGGAGEAERRGHLALPERDGHFQRGLQAGAGRLVAGLNGANLRGELGGGDLRDA